MSAPKRMRTTNFNKEEELILLDEICNYKTIIECKTSNKITCSEKENAWQKLLQAFNSKVLQQRAVEQLKAKYDNLKTKTRKDVAKMKLNYMGTGGGPSSCTSFDTSTEAVLDIINLKTVVGLKPVSDSDAPQVMVDNFQDVSRETGRDYIFLEEENVLNMSSDEIIISGNDNENVPLIKSDGQSLLCSGTMPVECVIKQKTSAHKSSNAEGTNWSSYTPQMLRGKKNTKLRSCVLAAEAKEIYYKKKKQKLP